MKKEQILPENICIVPVRVNQEKLQETIRLSKRAYFDHEKEHTLSYFSFLHQQSCYIQKRWWLMQGALLLLLWLILQFSGSNGYIQRSLGIAAPLFGLLMIPEIWKNRAAASMEIECTAFYSLRQIYSARILLFAMADFLLLSLFCLTAVGMAGMTMEGFLANFLLPFTITCCISFRTLCSKRLGSEAIALLLCMAWEVLWIAVTANDRLYQAVTGPVWIGLLLASLLYLVWCIQKSQKTCETLWEVNTIWN